MNLILRVIVSLITGLFIGFVFYFVSFGSCYGYPKSSWCENAEGASIILPLVGSVITFTTFTVVRNKEINKRK